MLTELKDLNERYGVHLAFEGGEAETFVLDGPIFKKRIEILEFEKKWFNDSGVLEIKDVYSWIRASLIGFVFNFGASQSITSFRFSDMSSTFISPRGDISL